MKTPTTKIHLAMQSALVEIELQDDQWTMSEARIDGARLTCLTRGPGQRLFVGTLDHGLWVGRGGPFQPVGPGIPHRRIMSLAVSAADGALWAGTEPSGLFRSDDGGDSWVERPSLRALPSRGTWSYPERPKTHHVGWIHPHPLDARRLEVIIHQGGLMRSDDGGLTWRDRVSGAPPDPHGLVRLGERLCQATGGDTGRVRPGLRWAWPPVFPDVAMTSGGYVESYDGGHTWVAREEGLEATHYLWSLAADREGTLLVSAARGPIHAHDVPFAETYLLRRTGQGPWQRVHQGLPPARGMNISLLAAHPAEAGVFFAANNLGLFVSRDGGTSWRPLPVPWPQPFRREHAMALIV